MSRLLKRERFLIRTVTSFEIYVLILISIGVPLLIFIGYSHYKKTKAFKSEVDIILESNPILRRSTVNQDVNLRYQLILTDLILKLSKDTISEDELNDMKKIQKEVTDLIKNRSLFNNLDIDYINKKIRKKSDYMM